MNKLKHKILSIILIPVLLFSTLSFNVDKHYCMDSIYSISIFGEADDCGMEMVSCEETTIQTCQTSNEDCCIDENQYISGSVVIKNEKKNLDTEQYQFITYFIVSKYYLFKSNLNKPFQLRLYSPPEVIKNISVLFQFFLI